MAQRSLKLTFSFFNLSPVLLVLLVFGAVSVEPLPVRAAAPVGGATPMWDLASQYPTPEAWDRAFDEMRARLSKLAKHRGGPIADATQLADLLDEARYLRGRAGNMARYALLTSSLDTTDSAAKAQFNSASGLEAAVEGGVSWLDSAVADLGASKIRAWQSSESRLRLHAWQLATILSQVNNRYARGTEAAYAALERQASTPAVVYEDLMQSDLGWPTLTDKTGKVVRLN